MVHDKEMYQLNATLSLVLCVFNIAGNSIISMVYIRFKKLRNMNNTTITMLSICDITRGVFIMLIKTYNHYTLATDLIEPLCSITAATSAFTFVFNPLLLALIAFIRYSKIIPWSKNKHELTKSRCKLVSLGLVLLALCFSILPWLGVGKYEYSKPHGVCFAKWNKENYEFRIIFYCIVIGMAFPILSLSYTKLYLVIRKHRKNLLETYGPTCSTRYKDSNSTNNNLKTLSVNNFSTTNIQLENLKVKANTSGENRPTVYSSFSSKIKSTSHLVSYKVALSTEKSRARATTMLKLKTKVEQLLTCQEYHVTKLMILIFIAYCICWMPAAIVNVAALTEPNSVPDSCLTFIVTFVELKTALNPIIYGFGNQNYRRASKNLFKKNKTTVRNYYA